MFKLQIVIFMLVCLLGCADSDNLSIYCPYCKRHVYDYKDKTISIGESVRSQDFKAVKAVHDPYPNQKIICPFDHAPLNGYEYWFWERAYKMPELRYVSYTFLTKKDGKFVWYPDDISHWQE